MKINISLVFLHTLSTKQKYTITVRIHQLLLKNVYFFSSQSIRMNGKKIIFDEKQIEKREFYKNKKVFQIHYIDVNKM